MNSEIRLDGMTVIITGAGRGLGRAHALLLAARGANVVVNDAGVTVDGRGDGASVASQVVDEIEAAGGVALASTHDISHPEGAAELVEAAIAAFGRLDGVVHNAGVLRDKTMTKLEPDDVRTVLAVHLEAAFWILQPAMLEMRKHGFGRVVLTTSASGLFGNFGQSNYGAAKMGLVGLMRVASLEGAKFNILINCVAPTARTRMTENLVGDLADRLDPEHVSPLVAYLMSPECKLGNRIFSAGGGRYASVFLGVTPGWVNRSDVVATPEEVASHMPAILETSGHAVPESGIEELRLLQAALTD